jgi:hypothetical protein
MTCAEGTFIRATMRTARTIVSASSFPFTNAKLSLRGGRWSGVITESHQGNWPACYAFSELVSHGRSADSTRDQGLSS